MVVNVTAGMERESQKIEVVAAAYSTEYGCRIALKALHGQSDV